MYALELSGIESAQPSDTGGKLTVLNVSRRHFLKATSMGAGSVFVLGVFSGCGPENRSAWPDRAGPSGSATDATFKPNVFVGLNEEGEVFIVCSRSEMGQGIRTSVPAIIADEMGADWSRCHIVQADGHPRFGNQNTDGSRSIRNHFDDWRRAGAVAREMLIAAAAQTWGVSGDDCEAYMHVVRYRNGKEISFGELAATASTLEVPEEVPFIPREKWRYIGTNIGNRDNHLLLTGAAAYGMDVRVDGMVYAAILRSPVLGDQLRTVDESAARAIPGVREVVTLPDATLPPSYQALGGVAVLADNTWAAFRGRDALRATWESGPNANWDSSAQKERLTETVLSPGTVVRDEGRAEEILAGAERVVEATYYISQFPHVPMEPPNALAWVKSDGSCEIWAPTQAPQTARETVAGALGADPESVTVHVTFLGGGFGRKSKPDYVVEAALLSREIGAPVQVVWSREDDIRHDYYHPPSAQHMKAALDAEGRAIGWLHRCSFPPISNTFRAGVTGPGAGDLSAGMSTVPYVIPNLRCEGCEAQAHYRIGWLRSVNHIHHGFSVNAFAAEMAHAAGRDARDYLLELIGPDVVRTDLFPRGAPLDTARLKGVIRRAATEAGWGQDLLPGHGLGIAGHFSFSSYVAHAVHASVEDGRIVVHRVDAAIDCGTAINLDRIRSQVEGAVVFGLTLALKDGIQATEGRVTTGNFDDYRLLLLDDTPDTHVHIMDSAEAPGGVGEPGVPPLAPALVGAILQATGVPVRSLPIRMG
jgi:isoquinoline 1-oxidoreductase subunit beta